MSASARLKLIKQKLAVKLRVAQRLAAQELAKVIPEVVKIRTRLESENRNNQPITALKPSTKKYRKRYQDNLHPDTDPNTSNLTATGQMLDAITGASKGAKVTVEIKNTKRKRELSGSKSKLTNKEVQRHVENKAGREFLELSKQERIEATELATQIIKDELTKL